MTIGKKLYWAFGAILAIISVSVRDQHLHRYAPVLPRGRQSPPRSRTCRRSKSIRYKMIENRLSLGNYLLSGDLRDEDKTNKGVS